MVETQGRREAFGLFTDLCICTLPTGIERGKRMTFQEMVTSGTGVTREVKQLFGFFLRKAQRNFFRILRQKLSGIGVLTSVKLFGPFAR